MTAPRSYDAIMQTAAAALQAGLLELIARKESAGCPADIPDKHKAAFAVEDLVSGILQVAADPPDTWSPLQREVSLALAVKLAHVRQI